MFFLGIFGNFRANFHYAIKGYSTFHFYTFKGMRIYIIRNIYAIVIVMR